MIVFLCIATYVLIGALTWRRQVRTNLRNTLADKVEETEPTAELYEDMGNKAHASEIRKAARTLSDDERASAVSTATFLSVFWPAWWAAYPFLRWAVKVLDRATSDAERDQEELRKLREIAKREGWTL